MILYLKIIFIVYFLVINFVAFNIMGEDKDRAKLKKWRIRERTMFQIALLFGATGIYAGMYYFHHKTRKNRFKYGIPLLLILNIILVFLIMLI